MRTLGPVPPWNGGRNVTFSAWYNLYREGLKCDFQARGTLCTTRRRMRLTGLVDPSSVERSQIPGPWRTT